MGASCQTGRPKIPRIGSVIFLTIGTHEPFDRLVKAVDAWIEQTPQKHEVIAVILRDREEEVPKKLGEVTLSHPQDSKKMDTYFGQRSIEKYLARLKENDEKLAEHFARYDIRSVKIFTDDEVVSKLVGLFV